MFIEEPGIITCSQKIHTTRFSDHLVIPGYEYVTNIDFLSCKYRYDHPVRY